MKRILTALLTICCICLPLSAQETTLEEDFYDADFFYTDEGEYAEAAYLYRKILQSEPDNANVKFLLGMCYNQLLGQEHEGIPYFEEAVQDIDLKYKARRFTETQAPHHAWFYLAEAYRKTNQMDKALDALNTFSSLKNFEKKYNVRITEDEIKAVERAKIIKDAELNVRALHFNEPINTSDNDYNGVISANGEMMVWANSRTLYEAVFMSTREGKEWTIPVLITPQIVSDGDLFPTGLSADGTTLLLVKRERRKDADIWYSQFDGMLWSPAQPLHGSVNTNAEEDHASFSPDGNRIYFASDRRGGEGKMDIWYSDRQANGQWGEPVNMGPTINTDRNETSAYITPDASRFIFSSEGHFNMGGYDIFRCELTDNGSWSQPTNIGFPINTTGDNTFYVPLNDGLSGLYTRYTNEGPGMQDLWYVEIRGEEGFVEGGLAVDWKEERDPLTKANFAIIIVDEATGEEIEVIYDAETDTFKALAGPNKSYKVISYNQN